MIVVTLKTGWCHLVPELAAFLAAASSALRRCFSRSASASASFLAAREEADSFGLDLAAAAAFF